MKHIHTAIAAFKVQPETEGGGTWFQTFPAYGEYDITGIAMRGGKPIPNARARR